jgi:MFS family permease
MASINEMNKVGVKIYGYRWIVLSVYMIPNILMQILWICYAPVSSMAAQLWKVSELQIGFLAMSFMYIYIVVSIPASWVIDKLGFRKAVIISVVVMAIGALLRAMVTSSFTIVMIATLAIAIVQPLMVNASTKLVAKWFPIQERATIVGIATLGPFLGMALGLMGTPALVQSFGFNPTYWIYGVLSAISAVLFIILARENPPTPAGYEERIDLIPGLKVVLKKGDFYYLGVIFFLVFAIWQGISTWVDGISKAKGLSLTEIGVVGGVMSLAGIVGALLIPAISDKLRKRKPVLIASLLLCIPGMLGFTYFNNYLLMTISSIWLGVFMVGCLPVVIQYAVEICYPAPEPASSGVLMVASQVSVVAINIMGWTYQRFGSFTPSLVVLTILTLLGALALFKVKESEMIQEQPV